MLKYYPVTELTIHKLFSNLILVNLEKVNFIGNLIIHCLKTKSM